MKIKLLALSFVFTPWLSFASNNLDFGAQQTTGTSTISAQDESKIKYASELVTKYKLDPLQAK